MKRSGRRMNDRSLGPLALLALIVPIMLLLIACGDGEAGCPALRSRR